MIATLLFLIAFPIAQESEKSTKELTAESVIARFVDAKGGKQQLLRIENYSISGVMEIVNGDERTEFGQFQIYQTEGRSVTQVTLPDGTPMSHGTDGKIAWSISEHGTASILKGQEARDFIRHHKTLHESLAWQEQFETIRYAGKKTIDNVETNHVIFVSSDNRQINRYFSAKDGLLIREEQFVGKRNSFQVATFSDYQECPNGTLVARQKTIAGDVFWAAQMQYKIKAVASNRDDIEKHLKIPESIAKLLRDDNAK